MTIDNEMTLFDLDNRFSADGVMNVGYEDVVRLMNVLFSLITIY